MFFTFKYSTKIRSSETRKRICQKKKEKIQNFVIQQLKKAFQFSFLIYVCIRSYEAILVFNIQTLKRNNIQYLII